MAFQQVVQTRGVNQYGITNERHVIWHHRLDPLTPDAKIGMIMAHGALGTADYYLTDSISNQIAPTHVWANGMPVIATDVGGAITWGNTDAQTAMDATLDYLHTITGARDDQVILLGQSMGAATVLNWAFNNPAKVAAIALHVPALNLQDIIDNDRGGLAATVTSAYGGTPPSTSDPAQNTAAFASMPIRIWYSNDDPICVPSVLTAFGSATGATMTNLGDVGHAVTGIDLDDMAAWVAQYL